MYLIQDHLILYVSRNSCSCTNIAIQEYVETTRAIFRILIKGKGVIYLCQSAVVDTLASKLKIVILIIFIQVSLAH
jgi:hypothetical protein